jgi:flavin reductase (DIM6/NTAB) family NADH-FMN oxidoreductase RutF
MAGSEEHQMTGKHVDLDPIAEALEQMPYGLYIIGSRSGDGSEVNGMMADWLMQVSFKPRLLGLSLENNSTTLRFVRESGAFSVNLLPATGRELAAKFCQPRDASKIQGRSESAAAVTYDKFRGVSWQEGQYSRCPVLLDAIAFIECEAEDFFAAGDHTIVTGKVINGAVLNYEAEPLTQRILGWSYAG